MMFLIFRIFMSYLNELCGFYHDPNVGFNLPWSGYPGLHLNHGENPKLSFWGQLQNIINTLVCKPILQAK
jgi:hypothetical protein